MLILLFFAFISGLVTIFAPCIWPLLPIVLSASVVGGDHRRAMGVTLGILVSFGILTITISYLVSFLNFDPNILRIVAVVILVFLGLTLLIPPLARVVESLVSRFAGKAGAVANTNGGFLPGFITGLALGIVWTPCAGPILATIATLSATRAVGLEIILVSVVYLIGVGIPLFVFAYAGQRIVAGSRTLTRYTGSIQKVFGVIIILTALLIFTNYDKVFAARLLDVFPGYSQFVTDLESNDLVKEQLDKLRGGGKKNDMEGKPFSPMGDKKINDLFNVDYPAPELTGIANWLNTEGKPLTLAELKGKVVLIDFWTYTCINCIRTLPHVTSWYDKYEKDGFVVIGVHTPEFEFEKNTANVENAIKQYNIHYPVAQDNNFSTWNSFKNQYWPAEYLIDAKGNVRRTHFGEGEYDEMEKAIQTLLKEKGASVDEKMSDMPDETPRGQRSPETYIGANRMQYYYPNGSVSPGNYPGLKVSKSIPVNSFTLGGDWDVAEEYSSSMKDSVLEYNFYADKVFLVMKPANANGGKVRILLDGKVVDSANAGIDVQNGFIPITSDRLYELINLHGKSGEHLLRIEFSPGVQVFAFTFG